MPISMHTHITTFLSLHPSIPIFFFLIPWTQSTSEGPYMSIHLHPSFTLTSMPHFQLSYTHWTRFLQHPSSFISSRIPFVPISIINRGSIQHQPLHIAIFHSSYALPSTRSPCHLSRSLICMVHMTFSNINRNK